MAQVVVSNICFFPSLPGEMIQFDYFSDGRFNHQLIIFWGSEGVFKGGLVGAYPP